MERTKFLAKAKTEVQRISLDDIMENLSAGEGVGSLTDQTEIHTELINIKVSVYHVGAILHRAKQRLAHGHFIPWINLTFGKELPYSTAYFYMRIYEVFKDDPKTIQFIPTKYLLMITERKFPDEIIKTLKENHELINNNSLQQIIDAYNEFKSGVIGGSQFLKLAKEQIKLGIDIWKGAGKHWLNANMRQSLHFGASDILNRIDSLRETAHEMAGLYPYDPNNPEHKKLIKLINDTLKGLHEFKRELEGGKGFFKSISTKDGDKYISNL